MASSMTILLINVPYFIFMISIVLAWWIIPNLVVAHVIIFAWIPILTSGLNPGIILARKREARNVVFGDLRGWVARMFDRKRSHSHAQCNEPLRANACSWNPGVKNVQAEQITMFTNKSIVMTEM